jgi:DNA transformation protein
MKAKSTLPRALKSLRVSAGFRDFVLDQLSNVRQPRTHPMFGAIGLYAAEQFFGLLAADVLYLRVDDESRGQYEAAARPHFGRSPGVRRQ